uniref:Uncharacterized protein n=1 Tax=Plectus sambesii TaxID=2011161 RepID=A0A914W9E3_9BILA
MDRARSRLVTPAAYRLLYSNKNNDGSREWTTSSGAAGGGGGEAQVADDNGGQRPRRRPLIGKVNKERLSASEYFMRGVRRPLKDEADDATETDTHRDRERERHIDHVCGHKTANSGAGCARPAEMRFT